MTPAGALVLRQALRGRRTAVFSLTDLLLETTVFDLVPLLRHVEVTTERLPKRGLPELRDAIRRAR